ncbi:VOC family protein [Demequina soli]|uniref:VOC family protein n=1 Tax=Demequina soli TaxID=1638987 RepID=UPI00078474E7|nr:VOC family protein [Demequina soli]
MTDPNISIPAADLPAATAHYAKVLGVEPYVDEAYYVGFSVGGIEVGLVPGMPGGPITYVPVADLDAALAAAAEDGGSVLDGPREVGGGLRVAVVADADGHALGLKSAS